MKPCKDMEEILWLDVYGELPSGELSAWQNHLEVCEGCRQERERMRRLIHRMRETMHSPELSQREQTTLTSAVKRQLKEDRGRGRRLAGLMRRPVSLIPAMAAACLLIAAFGWFGFKEFKTSFQGPDTAGRPSEQQMIAKNIDILKNLELFEEMDTIRKLVQLGDEKDVM